MKQEDLPTLAEYLIRYATVRPKLAMDRLLKVELIRNNLSKTSLYNMIIGTRRLIKNGKINKGMPISLAKEIQRQLNNSTEQPKEQPIKEEKVLTPYEQYQQLMADFGEINNFIANRVQEIYLQIGELENEKEYWRIQMEEVEQQKKKLEQEILEHGCSEILKYIKEK